MNSGGPAAGGPRGDTNRFVLSDGTPVVLRPLRPSDREAFLAAFRALSDRSRYLRFHKLDPRLRARDVAWLTEVDQVGHVALAVIAEGAGGIALGRFVRLPEDPATADLAVTVLDAWQRRGVAKLLLAGLLRRARELGVATLTASVLDENRPAMAVMAGLSTARRREGSAWLFDVPTDLAALPTTRLAANLVACDDKMRRRATVLGPGGPG